MKDAFQTSAVKKTNKHRYQLEKALLQLLVTINKNEERDYAYFFPYYVQFILKIVGVKHIRNILILYYRFSYQKNMNF